MNLTQRSSILVSFLYFVFLSAPLLYSHGFHKATLVRYGTTNTVQTIGQVIERVKKGSSKNVGSYDQESQEYVTKRVRAAGFSHVPFYCMVSFNDELSADIICSPTQHFYRLDDATWVPAHELQIGDQLLAKKAGSVYVSDIAFVQEQLDVYTLQVEGTHTFLVGSHTVVAHNIIVPVAATIGLGIPFSTGCGSGLGIAFGPVGFVGGIVLGGIIGCIVSECIKEYVGEYDVCLKLQSVASFGCNKNGKQPLRSVDDILEGTLPGRKTKAKAKQYIKIGKTEDAIKDFEDLGTGDIKKMIGKEGKVGKLPDGRTINVRPDSTDGRPTLEIQPVGGKGKVIKIRYEDNED